MDYKEITNPFILFPLVLAASYSIGIRGIDIIGYSFVVFLGLSIINNITQIITKKVKKRLFMFVYGAYIAHLALIIPLLIIINIKKPITTSFAILGFTEFIILAFYNITQRKDGKEIIQRWKNKLIKSERILFHPISLQRYKFKDFTISITDSKAINPTNCHITHLRPLKYEKIPKHIYKHQYGGNVYLFTLYSKKRHDFSDKNQTIKNIKTNIPLVKKLKAINKEVSKNIITAYMQGSNKKDPKKFYSQNESAIRKGSNNIKISIKKNFMETNQKEIYDFLKQCNKEFC